MTDISSISADTDSQFNEIFADSDEDDHKKQQPRVLPVQKQANSIISQTAQLPVKNAKKETKTKKKQTLKVNIPPKQTLQKQVKTKPQIQIKPPQVIEVKLNNNPVDNSFNEESDDIDSVSSPSFLKSDAEYSNKAKNDNANQIGDEEENISNDIFNQNANGEVVQEEEDIVDDELEDIDFDEEEQDEEEEEEDFEGNQSMGLNSASQDAWWSSRSKKDESSMMIEFSDSRKNQLPSRSNKSKQSSTKINRNRSNNNNRNSKRANESQQNRKKQADSTSLLQSTQMLTLNKKSDRILKNTQKYAELVDSLPLLRNFAWYELSSFQTKFLPISFFTSSAFWFMTCAEYFPRRMIYQNELDLIRDTRNKLDKQLVIEVVNRAVRYKSSANAASLPVLPSAANLPASKTDVTEDQSTKQPQLAEEQSIPTQQDPSQLNTIEDSDKIDQVQQLSTEEEEEQDINSEAATGASNTTQKQAHSQIQETQKVSVSLSKNEQIRKLVQGHEENIRQLKQTRVNIVNKYNYSFEDDVAMIHQRIFLLDLLDQYEINPNTTNTTADPAPLETQEEKLNGLQQLDLNVLLDLLCYEHKRIETETNNMFKELESRMCFDVSQERRINLANSLDFTDILVDITTLNPVEIEYLRYLEKKQQTAQPAISQSNNNNNNNNNNNTYLQQFNSRILESQQQQQQLSSKKPNSISHTQSNNDKNSPTEETRCSVCNECDYADNDLIVFCSRCNITVHQRCYGIGSLPSEDWVCETCLRFGPNGRYLPCAICSRRGGAMKISKLELETNNFETLNPEYHQYLQLCIANFHHIPDYFDFFEWENNNKNQKLQSQQTNQQTSEITLINQISNNSNNDDQTENLFYDFLVDGRDRYLHDQDEIKKAQIEFYYAQNQPLSKHIWVHLTCALWTPQCFFEDRASLNTVKGIENIERQRFSLPCSICKTTQKGSCVQCAKGGCTVSFHAECARRAGLCLDVRNLETMSHIVFCQQHTPLKLRRILEAREKKKKEEITKFCRSIEKFNDTYINNNAGLKIKEKPTKENMIDIKKAKKDQEKEEKDFMKCVSMRQLDMQCDPESFAVASLKLVSQNVNDKQMLNQFESLKNGQITPAYLNRLKQATFQQSLTRSDALWTSIDFNEYTPAELYKFYLKLIKSKKQEFRATFQALKVARNKSVQETIAKQFKQLQAANQAHQKSLQNQNGYRNNQKHIFPQKQPKHLQPQQQMQMLQQQKQQQQQLKRKQTNKKGNPQDGSISDFAKGKINKKVKRNESDDDDDDEDDLSLLLDEIDSSYSSDFPLIDKKKKHLKFSNENTKQQSRSHKNQADLNDIFESEDSQVETVAKTAAVATTVDPSEQLFCYCQQRYVEGELMIQCQKCEEWFHFPCVGYIGTEQQANEFDFMCQECDKSNSKPANKNNKKQSKPSSFAHLFNKESALYETYLQPRGSTANEQQQNQTKKSKSKQQQKSTVQKRSQPHTQQKQKAQSKQPENSDDDDNLDFIDSGFEEQQQQKYMEAEEDERNINHSHQNDQEIQEENDQHYDDIEENSDSIVYDETTQFFEKQFEQHHVQPETRFALKRSSDGQVSLVAPSIAAPPSVSTSIGH